MKPSLSLNPKLIPSEHHFELHKPNLHLVKDHMTENQYHKEYREYLELALQRFLEEKEGLSEYDARIQVMQDFENVEKRARLAGYL